MAETGAELIAAERQRQIEKENWTPEHDDQHHTGDQLAMAACCYAAPEPIYIRRDRNGAIVFGDPWPFFRTIDTARSAGEYSPVVVKDGDKREKHSRLQRLVIAGALIAAEIDRLQRLEAADAD